LLHHLAYVSQSQGPLTPELLSNILESSQRNNERDEITGILMCHDQLFFQVLEGEKSAVEQCYARIGVDSRHTSVSLILDDVAESRAFSGSTMEYVGPDGISQDTNDLRKSLIDLNRGKKAMDSDSRIVLDLANLIFKDSRAQI